MTCGLLTCLPLLWPLLQGYIYVEARKDADVKEAVRGLRMIYGSKPPALVPLREMVDAITVPRDKTRAIGTLSCGLETPSVLHWT